MTLDCPARANPRSHPRHPSLRLLIGAALYAVATWAACNETANAHGAVADLNPSSVIVSVVVIGALLLTLAFAARRAAGAAQARRNLESELALARVRAERLESMLDAWVWQTDREHRLTSLRPPKGAQTADWARPEAGAPEPLSRWLHPAEGVDLQGTLERHAAFDDIAVAPQGQGAPMPRGLLRGRCCTDSAGQFAGFLGTLRVAPAEPRSQPEPPRLPEPSAGSGAPAPGPLVPSLIDQESFIYTVSHDLRAPIRVVEGFTKIVKEDYGDRLDAAGNAHLDRVLTAAARMNEMMDALIALTKLAAQPLVRRPVDLSRLAADVVSELRRQAPERAVRVQVEPGLTASGDATLLRRVMENLVGNAWKYTSKTEGASIWVGRHPDRADRADTFSVRDNGAGFDMRYASRLFGVFQRLHSASDFPGSGVGLALVQRIVGRHGGNVWCEARVHQGATFYVSLPATDLAA